MTRDQEHTPHQKNKACASCSTHSGKRERILESAGFLFLQNGYERTSMSQIAHKASVSKGSLYNHFTNKEDLFTAFFEEHSRTKLNALEAISKDDHTDIRTALTNASRAIIYLLIDQNALGLYRIIIAESNRFPNLADTLWTYGFSRTLHRLSGWFARKNTEGSLRISDTDLAAEQFMTMSQTRIVQRRRLTLPIETTPEHIQHIANITADTFLKIYGP